MFFSKNAPQQYPDFFGSATAVGNILYTEASVA
jgi:hypothetical protein